MELVTFTNSNNLTLVGNLYPSVSDAIIIMCHGFTSNKYSEERFERLNKAFITCPVLIIHGNNDDEKILLCERSKRGMVLLSEGSKLEIIDGANHSSLKHYNILINLANDWFIKHFGC